MSKLTSQRVYQLNPSLYRCLCALLLTSLSLCSACTAQPAKSPPLTLSELPLNDVKASGRALMSRPLGLHLIERGKEEHTKKTKSAEPLTLLVHGFKSEGYEWVYALHKEAERGEVAFWRLDWGLCPREAGALLAQALNDLSQAHPTRPLTALGHSYGGLTLAHALKSYTGRAPLEAHLIAAPLAPHPLITARCGEESALTSPAPQGARVVQWRTQQALDGAFSSLSIDPQVSPFAPHVITLPERYRGKRLGHNWSVSAVADRLTACVKGLGGLKGLKERVMCFKESPPTSK